MSLHPSMCLWTLYRKGKQAHTYMLFWIRALDHRVSVAWAAAHNHIPNFQGLGMPTGGAKGWHAVCAKKGCFVFFVFFFFVHQLQLVLNFPVIFPSHKSIYVEMAERLRGCQRHKSPQVDVMGDRSAEHHSPKFLHVLIGMASISTCDAAHTHAWETSRLCIWLTLTCSGKESHLIQSNTVSERSFHKRGLHRVQDRNIFSPLTGRSALIHPLLNMNSKLILRTMKFKH